MLYNFVKHPKSHQGKREQDISITFDFRDLWHLVTRTRDKFMTLKALFVECQNIGFSSFAAYFYSFRSLPAFYPFLTGLGRPILLFL